MLKMEARRLTWTDKVEVALLDIWLEEHLCTGVTCTTEDRGNPGHAE